LGPRADFAFGAARCGHSRPDRAAGTCAEARYHRAAGSTSDETPKRSSLAGVILRQWLAEPSSMPGIYALEGFEAGDAGAEVLRFVEPFGRERYKAAMSALESSLFPPRPSAGSSALQMAVRLLAAFLGQFSEVVGRPEWSDHACAYSLFISS